MTLSSAVGKGSIRNIQFRLVNEKIVFDLLGVAKKSFEVFCLLISYFHPDHL